MTYQEKFSGLWRNKYGSVMKLEVDMQGRVQGKFQTAVGRDELAHLWKDQWFDVVGFVNRDSISLAITYGTEIGTMMVISGILDSINNQDKIETLSYTRFSASEKDKWRETTAAALTYERVAN